MLLSVAVGRFFASCCLSLSAADRARSSVLLVAAAGGCPPRPSWFLPAVAARSEFFIFQLARSGLVGICLGSIVFAPY